MSKDAATARKKLDRVFSQYIRLRDMIPKTRVFRCISCGVIKMINEADCGHYIPRQHMITRYNEQNCNAQCISCNRLHDGNVRNYRHGLIRKIGLAEVENLEQLKFQSCKLTAADYDALIEHYQTEIKRILSERGLTIKCLTE